MGICDLWTCLQQARHGDEYCCPDHRRIAVTEQRLAESHARETKINRLNFDLVNQNMRLREAIAETIATMSAPTLSRENFVSSMAGAQKRLSEVLRREENLIP